MYKSFYLLEWQFYLIDGISLTRGVFLSLNTFLVLNMEKTNVIFCLSFLYPLTLYDISDIFRYIA